MRAIVMILVLSTAVMSRISLLKVKAKQITTETTHDEFLQGGDRYENPYYPDANKPKCSLSEHLSESVTAEGNIAGGCFPITQNAYCPEVNAQGVGAQP